MGRLASGKQHVGLEMWGGVECTVNRVREEYHEQIERQGHTNRIEDLDRFAALGLTALRQPVLWEKVAPGELADADWSWPDRWLTRLRELGVRPIVGLVHHGSGPRHTSLLDPNFPEKLASYARAVAERYPWVSDYTPVNEILTTARFSALYGWWYPHHADPKSFAIALLNECLGTAMAMRAIREVTPHARLVATDDLGKVFSSPRLRYQAEFENERRWAGWDLLCGNIGPKSRVWKHLGLDHHLRHGLKVMMDHPCPPDIIGVNHYLSSERFLDDRVELYPGVESGSNGRHRYVDVLAARVRAEGAAGPAQLLRECWERFHIPIAITEVHNGCTREEQLRWFIEVYDAAQQVRAEGVNVVAMTAWALLGGFDWDHLVTQKNDHYEPGVFDLRSPEPRPTAIAHAIELITKGKRPDHPVLDNEGWWKRPQRLVYRHSVSNSGEVIERKPILAFPRGNSRRARPILITGGRGTLGRALARACLIRGLDHKLLVRSDMDIADAQSVAETLDAIRPWAVINAAGYVRVDDAEKDFERCYRENSDGPAVLAVECQKRGIRLATYSSDLVFAGEKRSAYVEADSTGPLNHYGRSKALAERYVCNAHSAPLIIRTSAFFGPWDEHNFIVAALREVSGGRTFRAADDSVVSPTYVPDLVNSTLDLLVDGEEGVLHLANSGEITWAELARTVVRIGRLNEELVEGVNLRELQLPAARPAYSALGSARLALMPSLEGALHRFFRESEVSWTSTVETAA